MLLYIFHHFLKVFGLVYKETKNTSSKQFVGRGKANYKRVKLKSSKCLRAKWFVGWAKTGWEWARTKSYNEKRKSGFVGRVTFHLTKYGGFNDSEDELAFPVTPSLII